MASGADIQVIKTEIDTDPLTRGYAPMTDQQVADDLNTLYRPGPAAPGALFNYLIHQKAREDASQTPTIIYSRLKRAAETDIGPATARVAPEVFFATGKNLTEVRHDACVALLALADRDGLERLASEDFSAADFEADVLQPVVDAGVMKPADRDAIKGFSTGTQSRARELGIGGLVRAGDVAQARAIP